MSDIQLTKHFVHEYELTDNPKDEHWMIDDYVYIAEEADEVIQKLQARIDELETQLKIARGGWQSNDDEDYRPQHLIQAEGIREMIAHFTDRHHIPDNPEMLEYANKLEKGDG